MRLNAGLVFLADSRTNAGVDQISTFRKMTVFEHPGERLLVLLSAGNLAITQAVRQIVCERTGPHDDSLWNAKSMFEAVRVVGDAVREVRSRDAEPLKDGGIEFSCNFILGGQIRGEGMRLFHVYSAGNFIEATPENPYFQIGESKYGKPIIDRVVTRDARLQRAAKAGLVSMDSTIRSNLTVGMPIDVVTVKTDEYRVSSHKVVEPDDEYFQLVRQSWGDSLIQAFRDLPDPDWL